jgi:hypothetical protein
VVERRIHLVGSANPQTWRRVLEGVVILANTILLAAPFIIMGEEFYMRWWNHHVINRIVSVLLVPVALAATFWIAAFIQIGTADRPLRACFALLGAFFLYAGLEKIWRAGLTVSSLNEGSLLFWGLAFVLAAGLGCRPDTPLEQSNTPPG